jgi:sugar lactone lactonase YvrE
MNGGYSQSALLAIASKYVFDGAMTQAAQLWMPARHRLGESIIWHVARRCYFWIDLLDPALWCHDPATGATSHKAIDLPPPIGSIAATSNPDLLMLAHRGGLSLLDVRSMEITPYCDPEGGRDAIIYNDMKTDRWGRLWVGSSHEREQEARGALWCVESRTRWALADAGFAISNGPAFSVDGRTMFFNDSAGRKTFAYDIAPDHLTARNRRILVTHPESDGLPDGAVVDSEDSLWTAQWKGKALLRFDRGGKLLQRIDVAAISVTTLCFGGPHLRDIKITTATDAATAAEMTELPSTGSLFQWAAPCAGVAEPLFKL